MWLDISPVYIDTSPVSRAKCSKLPTLVSNSYYSLDDNYDIIWIMLTQNIR